MLNEELIDTEEAKLRCTIARLKSIIAKFKEYDKERKEYYSKVLVEYGQLKSYIEELEDTDKKARKINNQRREICRLNTLLCTNKIKNIPELDLTKQEAAAKITNLNNIIKDLKKKLNSANKTISDLIYKLCKYERNSNCTSDTK